MRDTHTSIDSVVGWFRTEAALGAAASRLTLAGFDRAALTEGISDQPASAGRQQAGEREQRQAARRGQRSLSVRIVSADQLAAAQVVLREAGAEEVLALPADQAISREGATL